MDKILEAYEEMLDEFKVTKEKTPKISATLKKRAIKAEVDAKKIMDWFNRMLKDIDDLESKDAMKIMNVSGQISKIADKI